MPLRHHALHHQIKVPTPFEPNKSPIGTKTTCLKHYLLPISYPVMQTKKRVLAAAVAIPLLALGWAAFRPELIFVNKTVNEKLPTTSAGTATILASGMFASQAHETKGTAQLVTTGGKTYVRLQDFHTSNGPDVRVYLVKGTQGTPDEVTSKGFIDLGTIKGNIGDQNYEVPAGTNLDDFKSISIWCKRFSVGFGSAPLQPDEMPEVKQTSKTNQANFQLTTFSSPIIVTFGKAQGSSMFSGKSTILEENDKRYVESNFTKIPNSKHELRLVKKESLKLGTFPSDVKFENLGPLKKGKNRVSISKSLDVWLYRSIAVIDAKTGKVASFVHLRSEQEQNKMTDLFKLTII